MNVLLINLILMVLNVLVVNFHLSGIMNLKDAKHVEMDMLMMMKKMPVLDVLMKNQSKTMENVSLVLKELISMIMLDFAFNVLQEVILMVKHVC